MTFTTNSDLYVAIRDEGINNVIKHLMRQRPSLFNYGTTLVQANPKLLCHPIEKSSGVTQLITVKPPIPVVTYDPTSPSEFVMNRLGLDFIVQLTELEMDVHPNDKINFPAEIGGMKEQEVGFRVKICAGISCDPKIILKWIPLPGLVKFKSSMKRSKVNPTAKHQLKYNLTNLQLLTSHESIGLTTEYLKTGVVLPPMTVISPKNDGFICFCIELYGIATASFEGPIGYQEIKLKVRKLEIKDLEPVGLENMIECYLELVMNLAVFPYVNQTVSELAFKLHELPPLPEDPLLAIQFAASTNVPANPALEEHQLKLFTDLINFNVSIPRIEMGGDNGESGPPLPPRTIRNRTIGGPNHLTAAISEDVFKEVFAAIRDAGEFDITIHSPSISFFGVSASAEVHTRFHLEGGEITFQANNTLRIRELDIKWEELSLTLELNIPEICIEIPYWTPWGGWDSIELGCIFEDNPDISITIPLPSFFTSEISITDVGLKTFYGIGSPNEWMVFLDLSENLVDIDIIDIADTVGDFVEDILEAAFGAIGIPSAIADVIGDIVRFVLDIPDEIGEYLSEFIFDRMGLKLSISSYIAEFLADKTPLFRLNDPLEVIPAENALIAVSIPIQFLNATITADEIVLVVDVEA
jgi:hypothetical protein